MAEEARHARHGSCKCNCLFASVVGDGGKRGEWKVLCTRGKHRFASSKCLSLLDLALICGPAKLLLGSNPKEIVIMIF
jgi:hypothetical protein